MRDLGDGSVELDHDVPRTWRNGRRGGFPC